ncbi:hypothetical protein glysoja_013516 [Glycine soja]|nr:hypothetical protein glysoja_013516 [Glycine soja]
MRFVSSSKNCVQKQKNAASAGAKLFCFPGPSLIQIQA